MNREQVKRFVEENGIEFFSLLFRGDEWCPEGEGYPVHAP